MLLFPNCKINIGLNILDKRTDGYHNIETFFMPLAIKDALEIIVAPLTNDPVSFTSSGLAIDGDINSNLCIKAYQILKQDFPLLPNIKMHLHKNIPMGAGLGGGSADAAFTLKMLNEQFNLNLSLTQLINYALLLGSDCPFFINNLPSLGMGRGEILEPLSIDFTNYKIVIVYPAIHVNTKEAFEGLTLTNNGHPQPTLKEILKLPVPQWKSLLKNDFEPGVFAKYPELKHIKNTLYSNGATYASMSGSGSTLYGIFKKELIQTIKWDARYFVAEHSL